tara:strand:- start:757 stop:1377 length:621 start_codon:yes stop_codon:yes gene_type:complete
MDWLAIALIAVAAIILAADQAISDAGNIRTNYPWLRLRGKWRYSPLIILVLGLLILFATWGGRGERHEVDAPAEESLRRDDVIPDYVEMSKVGGERLPLVLDLIDAGSKKRAAPYTGMKSYVSGFVFHDQSYEVVDRHIRRITLDDHGNGIVIALRFEGSESKSLATLQTGEWIGAECEFDLSLSEEKAATFSSCKLLSGPLPAVD